MAPGFRAVALGDVRPARSRHAGRRSAVALADDLVVVGMTDGDVVAYDRDSLDERWRAERPGAGEATAVVAAAAFGGDAVAVGERGPAGRVRVYDRETGERRWEYATAADVGRPQRETRFFRPFVAALATDGDRLYAASRRYERESSEQGSAERAFESVVYAFDAGGEVAWSFAADASPIALDVADDRVAVAYNRCPGAHQDGLVVLDAASGVERWRWDPGTDGGRRVGDVSLVGDGAVVASHGDHCAYRLRGDGAEAWCADVAGERRVDGETLYAYPNHVHATSDGAVVVTGNTYSTSDDRETGALHPREHAAVGLTGDGEVAWTADVGGFASELGAVGTAVVVPGAQHFRTRDADVHGLRAFDVADGHAWTLETPGIVAAVDADDGAVTDGEAAVAAVTEPVAYHDDDRERGSYRLVLGDRNA